jgi:hypothetical protein
MSLEIVQDSGLQLIDFQLGDRVVYNPNMVDLLPAEERPQDHGTVIAIDENYITVKFDHYFNYVGKILPWGVSKLYVATG